MIRIKRYFRFHLVSLLALGGFQTLLVPALHAQSSQCATGVVDSTYNPNDGGGLADVEQTVCLFFYGGFDTYVETDNDSYATFNAEFGPDYVDNYLWVYGVAAQAQLWAGDSVHGYSIVSDTGMNYGSADNTGGPPVTAQAWDNVPLQQLSYVLYGLYSECGQQPGDFSTNGCNWGQYVQGTSYGLSVELQFLPPTSLTVETSATPSTYPQPVTFTSLLNAGVDAPTGNVTFYDGGTSIGTGTITPVSVTNLVPYSQQLGASTWYGYCGGTSNMTANTSDLMAPDGSATATKFVEPNALLPCGASGVSLGVLTFVPGGLQAGLSYTISVWLRGAVGGENIVFGLNDCAATSVTLTNYWQRYTYTWGTLSAGTAGCEGSRGFEILDASSPNATYYVWGVQTEQASSAGPYVATGSSPVGMSGGLANFSSSSLSPGQHSISTSWPGDAVHQASSSTPIIQTVYAAGGPPTVGSLSPSSGNVGLAVKISGSGFGAAGGQGRVMFNGASAGVLNWSDSSIIAIVPSTVTTGPVVVTLGPGITSNNNVIFTVNNLFCP